MSVPSRRASAALLLSLAPPPWHLRHSRAVAETAAWLARRAASLGRPVDRRLVEAAALLHDVDKLPAVAPRVEGLRHAEGSARWLAEAGYPELSPLVAGHPVTRLADGVWFEDWLASASPEALIVSYADKRAGQKLESMAERFDSWQRRYPPEERARRTRGSWSAGTVAAVRVRAERLERRVCELASIAPADVRRLAWTSRALRAARGG
jgi:putative nucleotidyltransferase with HDIG domain